MRGDGGGTVVSSLDATLSERSLRGLLADALKALVRSSAEKESLRGIVVREDGMGMVSVIFVVCCCREDGCVVVVAKLNRDLVGFCVSNGFG